VSPVPSGIVCHKSGEFCGVRVRLKFCLQLFSQILLGFNNNQEIDIEKLIKLLEENHHLLQDIAINEDSNQVSALPKVLLDLVSEVNDSKDTNEEEEEVEEAPKANAESQISHQLNSASEIVENLPKVWKVLIELLSHQSAPVSTEDPKNPCYKVVETPKGPHLVLSVSQTFIRLKVSRASPATLCSCETFSGPHLGEEVVGAGDLSLEATQQPPRGPHARAGEAPGASLHRAVRDLARGRQTPEETPTPPHPGEDPALRTGPEAQTPHRTQGRTGVQSREVAGGAREELEYGETVGTVAHRVRLEEERRR
jgi:hypothetical protein